MSRIKHQPSLEAGSPPPMFRTRLRMKHLELFRQVCELQSLRKAAEASNMTQPAATKLVRELEDMFDTPLFHRDRRGMRLTGPGEMVRRHIAVLLADVSHMVSEVKLFAGGGSGLIRLGIIPSLSSRLLAQSMNKLLEAHPQARFQLREGATDELMDELARNELDIIFGRMLHAGPAANLRVTSIYTETFDIVCGRRHPLVRKASVAWKDLAQELWVLPASGTPLREMAESMFTAHGVLRPVVAIASSSFQQMRFVIGAGQLLGILPRSIASRGQAEGDLVLLRHAERVKFAPISLIVRKDLEQPPLVEEFSRIVHGTARSLRLQ
jgi:DNA-binding transcriptional LysR family regulator